LVELIDAQWRSEAEAVKTFTKAVIPLSAPAGLLLRTPRWTAALGGAAQVDSKITCCIALLAVCSHSSQPHHARYVPTRNRYRENLQEQTDLRPPGPGYLYTEVTTGSELLHIAIAAIENFKPTA